jgi:adenylate cyclase
MPEEGFKRKLTAILSGDIVGYSRLMAEDEVATVRTLTMYRAEMTNLVHKYDGRVVDFVGDNMLTEFPSVLIAMECAVQMQHALKKQNAKLTTERRMDFRFGLHLGDVMIDEARIYGDGVNIAARLEGLAEPGGICISDVVYKQVHNKLDLGYVDLGERRLKNIPEPVRAYRIVDTHAIPTSNLSKASSSGKAMLSLPDRPSLAVLPFVNLSTDPEQDYFGDGLTMDIMTALVKISGLFLISEGSTFKFKSKNVTVRELGRQLGVRHVLEGGVRKAGDRVRITSRLVEAKSGRHIWAERFDRTLDDLFAVQDEITVEIVTALDVKLVSGEAIRMIRKTLRNPAALESYYRGWQALFGPTKEDVNEAQRQFEKTTRLEPESSVGYALGAWAHWWEAFRGFSDEYSRTLDKATRLAQEALNREDTTGLPHLMMAEVHLLKREYDQAIDEAELAILDRPSCTGAYAVKANILNYLGRSTEAIKLAKSAIRLTPAHFSLYPAILASAYYGSHRNEEAIAVSKEVLKRDSDNLDALLVLAGAKAAMSHIEEAHRVAQEILRVNPEFSLEEYAQSQPYKEPQNLDRVITMLRKSGLK